MRAEGVANAEWLLTVRSGALTYDQVLTYAAEHRARLAATIAHSPLPEEPDKQAADRLLIELQTCDNKIVILWDAGNQSTSCSLGSPCAHSKAPEQCAEARRRRHAKVKGNQAN